MDTPNFPSDSIQFACIAAQVAHFGRSRHSLQDQALRLHRVEARWDDQLSKAMLAKRMTVHEEAIVATWESSNG
jgi:thiamine biosynthesis protein ThiC